MLPLAELKATGLISVTEAVGPLRSIGATGSGNEKNYEEVNVRMDKSRREDSCRLRLQPSLEIGEVIVTVFCDVETRLGIHQKLLPMP